MSGILLQLAAAAALILFFLAVRLCKVQSERLKVFAQDRDRFHHAAMALITDERTPDDVARFAHSVGKLIDNPRMAEAVVTFYRTNAVPASHDDDIDVTALDGKTRDRLATLLFYGALSSANRSLRHGMAWRKVLYDKVLVPTRAQKEAEAAAHHRMFPSFSTSLPVRPTGPIDLTRMSKIAPVVEPVLSQAA